LSSASATGAKTQRQQRVSDASFNVVFGKAKSPGWAIDLCDFGETPATCLGDEAPHEGSQAALPGHSERLSSTPRRLRFLGRFL
jgi:hypothetical protein